MVGRTLITTALEETWPSIETPVLFLGEWCKLYSRKHIWEKYDSVTVPYHWDNRDKLYNDYQYLMHLYEKVLLELSTKLNEIHGTNHSIRYWRILIGPWLGYFIQILFDRFQMVQSLLSNFGNVEYRYIPIGKFKAIPNSMSVFSAFFISDFWNQLIYQEVLEYLGIGNKTIVNLSIKTYDFTQKKKSVKARLKESVLSFLSKTIVRENEAFIQSSYLPFSENIKLQLLLRQIPRIRNSVKIPEFVADYDKRSFSLKLLEDSEDSFLIFLGIMIPKHIPKVYIEGFSQLREIVRKQRWPSNSRFIFTSNSHNSDDLFKFYAAEQVEKDSKFFIGQHGGHYGVGKWSFMEDHEIKSSDHYLSWGWNSEEFPTKTVPCFSFILANKRKLNFDKKGKLLLVTMELPRYSYWMYSAPVSKQWLEYFSNQVEFVKGLNSEISNELLVRLSPNVFGWDQKLRWEDQIKYLKFDEGNIGITKLIRSCRLFVSTYNATTFLESMGQNIPTIMYWNPSHWELRESAIPYFEKLKKIGIFHDNPVSAAKKVNEVWSDVYGWWFSKEIQEVKNEFCSKYSRRVEKPIQLIENVLLGSQ